MPDKNNSEKEVSLAHSLRVQSLYRDTDAWAAGDTAPTVRKRRKRRKMQACTLLAFSVLFSLGL